MTALPQRPGLSQSHTRGDGTHPPKAIWGLAGSQKHSGRTFCRDLGHRPGELLQSTNHLARFPGPKPITQSG